MTPARLGPTGAIGLAMIGAALAVAQPPARPTSPPAGAGPTARAPARTGPAMGPPTAQSAATLKQVEAHFGFVPQFMRAMPAALMPMVWQTLSGFQMGDETALDGKTKELIGLAVAAQVPCEYCIMFHTEAARLNGASEAEIQEAVGMAAVTREMSTLLNGMQVDKPQFKRDLDRIVRGARQQARR